MQSTGARRYLVKMTVAIMSKHYSSLSLPLGIQRFEVPGRGGVEFGPVKLFFQAMESIIVNPAISADFGQRLSLSAIAFMRKRSCSVFVANRYV